MGVRGEKKGGKVEEKKKKKAAQNIWMVSVILCYQFLLGVKGHCDKLVFQLLIIAAQPTL